MWQLRFTFRVFASDCFTWYGNRPNSPHVVYIVNSRRNEIHIANVGLGVHSSFGLSFATYPLSLAVYSLKYVFILKFLTYKLYNLMNVSYKKFVSRIITLPIIYYIFSIFVIINQKKRLKIMKKKWHSCRRQLIYSRGTNVFVLPAFFFVESECLPVWSNHFE